MLAPVEAGRGGVVEEGADALAVQQVIGQLVQGGLRAFGRGAAHAEGGVGTVVLDLDHFDAGGAGRAARIGLAGHPQQHQHRQVQAPRIATERRQAGRLDDVKFFSHGLAGQGIEFDGLSIRRSLF